MGSLRMNAGTILKIGSAIVVFVFLLCVVAFGAHASTLEMKINPQTDEVIYGNHFPDGKTDCKDPRITSCESGMWTTHLLRKGNEADMRLVYDNGLVEFRCDANSNVITMIAFGSYNGRKVERLNALTFYTNMRAIKFQPVPNKDLIFVNIPRGSQFAQDLPETELTFSNTKAGVLMHFQWDDENIRTNYRLHMKVFLNMCNLNKGNS